MPTSSQALILFNSENGKEQHDVAEKSKSYFSLRDPARLSVARVYNINGFYSIPATQLKNEEAVSFLGTAAAQLFKFTKLPKGFESILSFDPLTKAFCWRVLGGQETSTEARDEDEIYDKMHFPGNIILSRPVTAVASRQKHTIDKDLYDRLMNLGFRASGFNIREGSKSTAQLKSTTRVTAPRYPIKKNAVVRKTSSEPSKLVQGVRTTEERKVSSHIASEEDEDDDKESASLDEDVDADGFYRILPSVCMRKEMPPPRPRAAIFCFRDNEERSHKEVKDLILEQTGLTITGLQFDPVNLRATKPGIRSRWIADFSSVTDAEMFIRIGLKTGKDKMIIYKFDDIARREFSTFKYYKTIQDAKKTLKGSKSEKRTDKVKKVVRLREAKSKTVETPTSVGSKIARKRSYDR